MSTRSYPAGLDCVWLAADREGHVGAFVTAGVGPIPVDALREDLLSVEELEDRVLELPPVSGVELRISVPRPDSFLRLAERGLFVYDWRDVHRVWWGKRGAYEIAAVPTQPLERRSLPPDLAAVVDALLLEELRFSARAKVDVRRHLRCAAPE